VDGGTNIDYKSK